MTSSTDNSNIDNVSNHLKLLSYNIQVGIPARQFTDYITRSWRHVFPSRSRWDNLDKIAELLTGYDIVALQEVDAGGLRSNFVNQVEYLSYLGEFPFWHCQCNRNLAKVACHANGLLSRVQANVYINHRLPGKMPGRGAIEASFGNKDDSLLFMVVHLALGSKARQQQLSFIAETMREYQHVVLMGDMNCTVSEVLEQLAIHDIHLTNIEHHHATYPSWNPRHAIDQILVSPDIKIHNIDVLPIQYSDHCPISMDIELPASVKICKIAPTKQNKVINQGLMA